MKIKAELTREESELLYDLIAKSIGTGKLYKVICRRLIKYADEIASRRNVPLPYSDLTKEDWVLLHQLLNLSPFAKEELLGYKACGSHSLWRKIGKPLDEYLYLKGIPTE
tara:strand:+ start:2441 stop:2770 length:330 start_codon:yes stop_codon:yes gene_type:complete